MEKSKTYGITEIFRTVQGEGYWTGCAAIFVRFAGCNLWNGISAGRKPAALKILKAQPEDKVAEEDMPCPAWCDTDFALKHRMTSAEIVGKVRELSDPNIYDDRIRHFVFTGGEPLLQFDQELYDAFCREFPTSTIQIETNGTLKPKFLSKWTNEPWITCSPKVPPRELALSRCNEIKLVYPLPEGFETPEEYINIRDGVHLAPRVNYVAGVSRAPLFLQPRDDGERAWNRSNLDATLAYIYSHPQWRLSVQTHKQLGLP